MTVNKMIEILQSLSEHEKEQEILIQGYIWSSDYGDYTDKKYFTVDISDKRDLYVRTIINNTTKEYKTWNVIPCFSELPPKE